MDLAALGVQTVEKDVIFEHGPLGLLFSHPNGFVHNIRDGGQAKRLGVQTGWRIRALDGKPFDPDTFAPLVNEPRSCHTITFDVPPFAVRVVQVPITSPMTLVSVPGKPRVRRLRPVILTAQEERAAAKANEYVGAVFRRPGVCENSTRSASHLCQSATELATDTVHASTAPNENDQCRANESVIDGAVRGAGAAEATTTSESHQQDTSPNSDPNVEASVASQSICRHPAASLDDAEHANTRIGADESARPRVATRDREAAVSHTSSCSSRLAPSARARAKADAKAKAVPPILRRPAVSTDATEGLPILKRPAKRPPPIAKRPANRTPAAALTGSAGQKPILKRPANQDFPLSKRPASLVLKRPAARETPVMKRTANQAPSVLKNRSPVLKRPASREPPVKKRPAGQAPSVLKRPATRASLVLTANGGPPVMKRPAGQAPSVSKRPATRASLVLTANGEPPVLKRPAGQAPSVLKRPANREPPVMKRPAG